MREGDGVEKLFRLVFRIDSEENNIGVADVVATSETEARRHLISELGSEMRIRKIVRLPTAAEFGIPEAARSEEFWRS
jgi:hypothetical protein